MNKNREVPIIVVIKRPRPHGHHGGAWKVAFADFMTAMFALFLVLWLVDQSSDVKSAIAGYFQDPLGRANEFGSSIMPGEGAQASTPRLMKPPEIVDLRRDRLQQLAQELEKEIDQIPELAAMKAYIEITITDEGLRVELMEDSTGVFFQTGSAMMSGRGRQIVDMLGTQLTKVPNHVRLEGYTDARPYPGGSRYTNWELSADRANAARRILVECGVDPARVDQIRGLADRELRVPDDPFSPRNRRISITVLLPKRPSVVRDSTTTTTDVSAGAPSAAPASTDTPPSAAPAVPGGGR